MTREEQVDWLCRLKADVNNEVIFTPWNKKFIEALDMAIKALEQEPKTEKIIKMREATPEERESIDKYIKSISKPTGVNVWDLEQQQKTGHWIDRFSLKECKCSVCDYLICISSGSYLDMAKNMKFCPNCGARMLGSEGKE